MAIGERAADAAHLEAKVEILFVSGEGEYTLGGSEVVSVPDNDVAEADCESYDYHPEKRSAQLCPPASGNAQICRLRRGRRGIHSG